MKMELDDETSRSKLVDMVKVDIRKKKSWEKVKSEGNQVASETK